MLNGVPESVDQHRAERNAIGRLQISAEQEAVAHIEVRAAVVRSGIKLIRRKVSGARRIGFGEVQHVEAEQRHALCPHRVIHHQLVLVVHAARLELVDVLVDAVRTSAGSRGRIVGSRQEKR